MSLVHKISLGLAALVSVVTLASFNSSRAYAAFDPSNIIDNSVFDNSQTMSANDIQAFLNGFPKSCLKNYMAPYPLNYSDYGENVSASTVIRRAADLWGINPQVILATLEKEQSLVSGGLGCSPQQYNAAIGMGCPDGGTCPAPAYAGFSRQVTKGAWLFMFNRQRSEGNTAWNGDGSIWYSNRMTAGYRARTAGGTQSYYDGYTTIDGSTVYLSNGATTSLYNYTPHFHGNQNFVLIFEKWFGTVHGTFLLQSPSSPAVYLMNGTTRYGVPSYDVLRAYGFDDVKVTPVSDAYMQSLTDGGVLGYTFKKEGENAIYFADNGYRFGFATYSQCTNWGYPDCLGSSSKSLSPAIFNQLRDAGAMKSLMLNGSSVFLMDSGNRRPFLSGKAMTENGFSNSDIVPVTNFTSANKPAGFAIPENNSFISFKTTPVIYIYADGKFYPINSYDVFRSVLPPNTPVYSDTFSLYNSQAPALQKSVSQVVSSQSGAKTYLLTQGSKYDITATASDWQTPTTFDEINAVLNKKPATAATDTNSTFQTPAGMIFKVGNKTILPFYNLTDFFSSSYSKQPLTVADDAINSFSTGNPLVTPGGGSLFKVSTPGKENLIFTLNLDGSSCNMSSLAQLADFNFNATNVQRINESMSAGPVLSGLVKTESGALFIVSGGTKTPLSTQSVTAWGINQSSICTMSNAFLARLTTVQSNKPMTFARLPSGIIYYAQGNVAHQVLTYDKFLSLGGNSANTVDVSQDFSSYATVGSPIN